MSVFRVQSNVPDVYINESRDFQLFCRLYDSVMGGVRFDIDSMLNVLDTGSCNNILLQLLQSKVGFFTNADITTDELKVVIDAFPLLLKNKGSLLGLKQAVNTFLKAKKLKTGSYINVINEEPNVYHQGEIDEPYVLNIGIEADIQNTLLLDILFYYILPTGYTINYYFYSESASDDRWIFDDTNYRLIFSNPYVSNSLDIPPEVIIVDEKPAPSVECVGKIYAVRNHTSNGSLYYDKYYCDYTVVEGIPTHTYVWKKVTSEDYRSTSKLGVTEISKFYPLSDNSNPDTYKILDLPLDKLETYRKSEAVCGYYFNERFYFDENHTSIIEPICESNKLCYYDIPNRNYYIWTTSYNTPAEGDTKKFVLVAHEEDFNG